MSNALVDFVAVPTEIAIVRCIRQGMMPVSAFNTAAVEDISIEEPLPFKPGPCELDENPHYVWVLVAIRVQGREQVWVRYAVEGAPEGIDVRAAAPARAGSDGVVVVTSPSSVPVSVAEAATPKRRCMSSPVERARDERVINAPEPIQVDAKAAAKLLGLRSVQALYSRVRRGQVFGVVRIPNSNRYAFNVEKLRRSK